jgi:hypothetical protein
MALVERDADPIFFTPNDVAGPLDLVACYKKREAVRNEQRGDYFERCTGFRDVPNGAVNPAAAELNRSSLQHAATWRDPVFVHGLLHARGRLGPFEINRRVSSGLGLLSALPLAAKRGLRSLGDGGDGDILHAILIIHTSVGLRMPARLEFENAMLPNESPLAVISGNA